MFGNVGMANDPSTFNNLLAGNTFTGPTDITTVDVTALPIATYASFAAAADIALNAGDASVGLQNPLWTTQGVDLYTGSPGSIALNTSGLGSGQYILRTTVFDADNGGLNYGLSAFELVPEPASLTLSGIALAVVSMVGLRRRLRTGQQPKS
jgi:hypothetical protein